MENAIINDNEEIQALVSIMDELTTRELELKGQLKQVEKEKEKHEFQMQEILKQENKDIITCGYWSFGWDVKERTAFDQKKFREAYPAMWEEFKTTSEIRKFCFGHLDKKGDK